MKIELRPIGTIYTPYEEDAPYQPVEEAEGDFRVVLDTCYQEGLDRLEQFNYIYLIYYLDRLKRTASMRVRPPWAGGMEVGLFASRSPLRPNPIGLSIVRLRKIQGNVIHTSGLDVFNRTPLLDIKPYIKDLDSKIDSNYGWIEKLDHRDHLMLHIKGIPHDY